MIATPQQFGRTWAHGHMSNAVTIEQVHECRMFDGMDWRSSLKLMPEAMATVANMMHLPPTEIDEQLKENLVSCVFFWWMVTHYAKTIASCMADHPGDADVPSALLVVMMRPDDGSDPDDPCPYEITTLLMPAANLRTAPFVPAKVWDDLAIAEWPADRRLVVFMVPRLCQSFSMTVDLQGDDR